MARNLATVARVAGYHESGDGEFKGFALVSVHPVTDITPRPRGRSLGDGATVCGKCGHRSHIPHHLSLIFWRFWTREQLQTLLQQMKPGERLAWIAHRLVRLQAVDGTERHLRESGVWVEERSQNQWITEMEKALGQKV